MSSPPASSALRHVENDDVIRAQLSSLPTSSDSERAYAAIAKSLLEQLAASRLKADSERRKAEQAQNAQIAAIQKLMALVQSEGESLISSARDCKGATPTLTPHSSFHTALGQQQGAHLSRRVSFNKDILMVVSPEIGHGDASERVPVVDEDDEDVSSSASSSVKRATHPSSSTSSVPNGTTSSATGVRPPNQRRLSRTEFNEGAILRAHLTASDLEKENLDNAAAAAAAKN